VAWWWRGNGRGSMTLVAEVAAKEGEGGEMAIREEA